MKYKSYPFVIFLRVCLVAPFMEACVSPVVLAPGEAGVSPELNISQGRWLRCPVEDSYEDLQKKAARIGGGR